jgi:predicted Ser/Thr protein kinase
MAAGMECLDANVVQDLMSGALDDTLRGEAMRHLDGCDDCRLLISTLAREAVVDTVRELSLMATAAPTDVGLMETIAPPSVGMMATVASSAGIALLETAATDTSDTTDGTTKPLRIRSQQPGKRLGRYTVLERLGAGAMGVVYRAEDPELGRKVALKLLHRPDASLTDRLVREARSMAQVNHPNVVAVYDVGEADGASYIAMELVEGQSLRAWQATPRTVNEVVEAYIAAGRGLAAAHAAGIVHRDFKPDNCLVGGADGRVRVTDFGLAAARPSAGVQPSELPTIGDVNLTTSGSVLGTPAYMAPEQFSAGNVDARTDQFNFCVSLYEALYGQRPFAGKTFPELGENVCEGRVRPAPPASKVSGALRAIILRGLAVKPGDRFPTMDHLLTELGRDRARPWRRTAWIAVAIAGLLAIGLGVDWIMRDRLFVQIHESFALTATQVDRAVALLTNQFDINANQVYTLAVMRDVASHHDQADFGLGDEVSDAADLEKIQEELQSQDWIFVRRFGSTKYESTIAVADYTSRLLYTSADPAAPRTDLAQVPWIKQALDSPTASSIVLLRADDPRLVTTGILGKAPASGLVFLFTRTLLLNKVPTSQLMQLLDAATLLHNVRLDKATKLSLVAPDGTSIGEVPGDLAADEWVVSTVPIAFDGTSIGSVVMARELGGGLALFPHARLLFALAMFASLGLFGATALRARQITNARA